MKRFEFLDHTADVILQGHGDTLAEAFAAAADGLFAVITDLDRIAKNVGEVGYVATLADGPATHDHAGHDHDGPHVHAHAPVIDGPWWRTRQVLLTDAGALPRRLTDGSSAGRVARARRVH